MAVAKSPIELTAFKVKLSGANVISLESHTSGLQVQRRCFETSVFGAMSTRASCFRERDDSTVVAVAQCDPGESGQRLALALDIVVLSRDSQGLLVARERPVPVIGTKSEEPVGIEDPTQPRRNTVRTGCRERSSGGRTARAQLASA
jgi:hypothetical protein